MLWSLRRRPLLSCFVAVRGPVARSEPRGASRTSFRVFSRSAVFIPRTVPARLPSPLRLVFHVLERPASRATLVPRSATGALFGKREIRPCYLRWRVGCLCWWVFIWLSFFSRGAARPAIINHHDRGNRSALSNRRGPRQSCGAVSCPGRCVHAHARKAMHSSGLVTIACSRAWVSKIAWESPDPSCGRSGPKFGQREGGWALKKRTPTRLMYRDRGFGGQAYLSVPARQLDQRRGGALRRGSGTLIAAGSSSFGAKARQECSVSSAMAWKRCAARCRPLRSCLAIYHRLPCSLVVAGLSLSPCRAT
jgi:hypothetical protein